MQFVGCPGRNEKETRHKNCLLVDLVRLANTVQMNFAGCFDADKIQALFPEAGRARHSAMSQSLTGFTG
jgi:hypothetical protein